MQEKATKPTQRIKQISVTGLFGMFNHVIPLHMEDRITIIHGPNGFGKTAILKLVNALFSRDSYTLENTPFDELIINFEDHDKLAILKTLSQSNENEKIDHFLPKRFIHLHDITFEFTTQNKTQSVTLPSKEPNSVLISAVNNRNIVESFELKPGQNWSLLFDTLVAERETNRKETEWLSNVRR